MRSSPNPALSVPEGRSEQAQSGPAVLARYAVDQADGRPMDWELLGGQERVASRPAEPVERVQGHHYALRVMLIAINWVCEANTSFRAAAKCFEVLQQAQASAEESPSFWAIRLWVLRVGFYELKRPKPQANDWVLIVDSTIAVGQHKALVILGARLGELERRGFNLGHQDVSTLELRVLSQCTGPAVQESLEAASRAVGEPRAIVSDGGSEIKKGVRLFQADHPEVDWNYDLTHRFALLLEKELGTQEWWAEFITRTNQCRQGCQQTPWSHLQPPAPRLKARWLNVRPLVNWALHVLDYQRQERPSDRRFTTLFGWLKAYRKRLQRALQMVRLLEETCCQIKHQGLNGQQVEQCAQRIEQLALSKPVRTFAQKVLAFLREQAAVVRAGETLLGSSDVIESLFGKYKAVIKRSPLHAITIMVLLVAALTSERTEAVIQQALNSVSTADVQAWFAANGEPSLLAKRRQAFHPSKGTDPA